MTDRKFVDTNVPVYSRDTTEPEKHATAQIDVAAEQRFGKQGLFYRVHAMHTTGFSCA